MLQLVTTADGSKTIYNSEVGENYHSRHGALQESQHVFLNSGLKHFLSEKSKISPAGGDLQAAEISVLEVGFGTGLNFLLSADYCADHKIKLSYTGVEAYPLTEELISQTGYNAYISPGIWQRFINTYTEVLNKSVQINSCCKLEVACCQLINFNTEKQYEIIYFDAFASVNQPEMWNQQAIAHTIQFLKPGGIFVTYAITGNLKRQLKALGLKVEKAPGAPGKREMLRAIKP